MWKTSAMPTLMFGLPEGERERFMHSSTLECSHEDTKKVHVKPLGKVGWRLSG